MGLFDKKYCDICGEKIGLLGNRKLENGNLCKNCAQKLSPWFSDRRNSTVEEIKAQLDYREENQKKVAAFHTTRTLGADTKVLLDEDAGKFMVTRARNLAEANPDVLDFADVTAVMQNAGMAHMGVGRAAGKNKAEEAAKMAISSPLLETSINGAHGVLINVTGSMDIGLEEVEQAASLVQDAVHPDAVTIFGATFDESLEDEIRVTVIATGFAENKPEESQPGAQTTAQPAQASQPAAAQQPAPQPAVSQQAQQLNESVDQEARAARESIDRAYEDIFRIFSKDK